MYREKEEEIRNVEFKVKREEAKCVTINVFVKCEKEEKKEEDPCKKEEHKEKKEEQCVTINVFVECDK